MPSLVKSQEKRFDNSVIMPKSMLEQDNVFTNEQYGAFNISNKKHNNYIETIRHSFE